MSNALIGVVFFLIMMVMVFCGIPVFISMLTASLAGLVVIMHGNPTMMLMQFTSGVYNLGANYNYAVLPLFSLVGALVSETGVAEGAFACFEAWLKRVKGGLLYTVVAANAVFGACSGSSIAGNIVFGKLSIPQLRKRGYDEKLSLGCIAASGAHSVEIYETALETEATTLTDMGIVIAEMTAEEFDLWWSVIMESKVADTMAKAEANGATAEAQAVLQAAADFTGYELTF